MRAILLTVLASIAFASTAKADLIGTELDVTVQHDGPLGGIIGPMFLDDHDFGSSDTFTNGLLGTWKATTSNESATQNKLLLDFSFFNYTGLTGSIGTVTLADIAEDVVAGSVKVSLLDPGNTSIGVNIVETHNGFIANWRAADVLDPTNIGGHMVQVTWTSVPAPGALALLSLAGMVRRGRRRR